MKKVMCLLFAFLIFTSVSSAQNNLGIGVGMGTEVQTGTLSNVWSPSFGGTVQITYNLSSISRSISNFELVLSGGYYSSNVSNSFNTDYSNHIGNNVDVDWPFTSYPISAGVRYYFIRDTFKPYLTTGAGMIIMKIRKVTITSSTGTVSNNGADQRDNSFKYYVGAGNQLDLFQNIRLDFNILYEISSKKIVEPINQKASNLSLINFNLGVVYGFRL